jgi:hypothetical protein
LREVSKKSGIPSDEPFKAVVLKYLNIMQGNSGLSKQFWDVELKRELQLKYPKCKSLFKLRVKLQPLFMVFDTLLFQWSQEIWFCSKATKYF